MNKTIVIGNVGQEPEGRYTPNGTYVSNFSVASNRRYKMGNGETREEVEWFRVSAFGKLGEICNQYLTKGRQVYVEGRLSGSAYIDRDGQPRYSLNLNANEVQFLGGGNQEEGGERQRPPQNQQDRREQANREYQEERDSNPPAYDETDDLPF